MKKMRRFRVMKNGSKIGTFDTLDAAKGCITRLYNSGRVMPYDSLVIYDCLLLYKINY